jgi:hypothetical protein
LPAHLIRQLSGVRIQTSYQKYIMGDICKEVANKLGTFEKMFKTRINKKKLSRLSLQNVYHNFYKKYLMLKREQRKIPLL